MKLGTTPHFTFRLLQLAIAQLQIASCIGRHRLLNTTRIIRPDVDEDQLVALLPYNCKAEL